VQEVIVSAYKPSKPEGRTRKRAQTNKPKYESEHERSGKK